MDNLSDEIDKVNITLQETVSDMDALNTSLGKSYYLEIHLRATTQHLFSKGHST